MSRRCTKPDQSFEITQPDTWQQVGITVQAFLDFAKEAGHVVNLSGQKDDVEFQILFSLSSPLASIDEDKAGPATYLDDASHCHHCRQPMQHRSGYLRAEDIREDVEQALKDYYRLSQLCRNPLNTILDLRQYTRPEDSEKHIAGLALRRLLDEIIDRITGPEPGMAISQREHWRVDHYLHLRYRKEFQHQQIAHEMGYSDRNLLRRRSEYIEEVAESILPYVK